MSERPRGLADERRWAALLAAVWLGLLLTVAGIATPAGFALFAKPDAGRLAGRILAQEAAFSVGFAAVLMVLQRVRVRRDGAAGADEAPPGAPARTGQFDAQLLLTAGALFCTILGYYALLPLMDEARQGRGVLGFGALHGISTAFFAIKTVAVAFLAWRLSAAPVASPGGHA